VTLTERLGVIALTAEPECEMQVVLQGSDTGHKTIIKRQVAYVGQASHGQQQRPYG